MAEREGIRTPDSRPLIMICSRAQMCHEAECAGSLKKQAIGRDITLGRSRPGFRVRAGFDSGRGDCGDRNGMARAYAPGSLLFYFCQLCRASSCWHFCWYRQQSTTKITLHSNGYGSGRVSARGTKLKTQTITIT